MSEISVVKGDTVSNLVVSLVREDNGIAFSAGAGGSVNLRIRKVGSTTISATIANDSSLTGVSGDFVFPLGGSNFLASNSLEDGYYEGELEVTFVDDSSNQTKQTVFEPISIRVRDDFD